MDYPVYFILFHLSLILVFCIDQNILLLQALLSILADYTYFHKEHIVHGLDRYYALINICVGVIRTYYAFNFWLIFSPMIFIYFKILDYKFKKNDNIYYWHISHFFWHLTSSFLVSVSFYGYKECGNEYMNENLKFICK